MAATLQEALERSLIAHADRPAVITEDTRPPRAVTYRELAGEIAGRRNDLLMLGARPGRALAIAAERAPESIALALAAILEHAAVSWLNPRYHAEQTDRAIAALSPFAIAVGRGPAIELRVPEPPRTPAPSLPDDVAWVLFTSGSTGEPKGVLIGAADLLACTRTEIDCFEISEHDALLCVLPFSFDVGLNQMFSALVSGATLHLSDAWLRRDLDAIVGRSGISGIHAVPAIWLNAIHNLRDAPLFTAAPRLRYITVSGGSLAPEPFDRLDAALGGGVAIHKTYGQSETFRTTQLLAANARENAAHRGSVGRALPGVRLVIARDRYTVATPGELGEIVHLGDGAMLGYLGDDPRTSAKLGVHAACPGAVAVYTGDRGHVDADGYLYLAGRADGMIKTAGNRLYPGEIEKLLASHAAVVEAVAFGVPDDRLGERAVAVIIALPGTDPTELRRFLSERLPSYAVPREVVIWPDLPRLASGKPDLVDIRQRYLGTAA